VLIFDIISSDHRLMLFLTLRVCHKNPFFSGII